MGKKVEAAIRKIMKQGHKKSSAIRILKAAGAIRQKGKHLVAGKR